MKKKLVTVPASYEILDRLDTQPVEIGIEECGRVCYKSEHKIGVGTAPGFCRGMVKHKHSSVIETRVLTFLIGCANSVSVNQLYYTQPKYLIIDRLGSTPSIETLLITGSIRAFREMVIFHPDCLITRAIVAEIAKRHPFLFEDILAEKYDLSAPTISARKLSLVGAVDNLSPELKLRHRHIAVKFIVNRAVTHEIVRHRPCIYLQESQRYCRYSEDQFDNRVTFIRPMFFKEGTPEYSIWEEQMLQTEEAYLRLLKTSSPQASRTVLPNSCKTELIVYTDLRQWNHIFHMRTSKAAEPSMREVMIPLQADFKKMFPDLGEFNTRLPNM